MVRLPVRRGKGNSSGLLILTVSWLFFDFPQNAAGVATCKYPFRYIFCHHAARSYHSPCTDSYTGADDGSTSYPDVIVYLNIAAEFQPGPAITRAQGVCRCVDLNRRPE
jgi:hypothetical protein